MVWSTPMTAVAGSIFTAAQFNQFVRDNLMECPAAKATTASGIFAATGANAIAQRIPDLNNVTTQEGTVLTTYGDLATPGPALTITTGVRALIGIHGHLESSVVGATAFMSVACSGASTFPASDTYSLSIREPVIAHGVSMTMMLLAIATAGSNTYTCKYRSSSGAATATFKNRRLFVIPL